MVKLKYSNLFVEHIHWVTQLFFIIHSNSSQYRAVKYEKYKQQKLQRILEFQQTLNFSLAFLASTAVTASAVIEQQSEIGEEEAYH